MTNTPLFGATLSVVAIGLTLLALTPKHEGTLPRGLKPVLAAELVKDTNEVEQVYGTDQESKFRKALRLHTSVDLLFIVCYGVMYFLLGRLLPGISAKIVAVAVPLAAIADILEDVGIFRATYQAASDALAQSIRIPSLTKWTLLGIVWILVARAFAPSTDPSSAWRWAGKGAAACYAAAGIACLAGVLGENSWIALAGLLSAIAAVLQSVILWRSLRVA